MKASLKTMATEMQGSKATKPLDVRIDAPVNTAKGFAPLPSTDKNYRTANTRANTRQLSGHFPGEDVQAFRVLAASLDMDVQELLAEAINMAFERHGLPNRIEATSGRRKRL